MSGLRMALTDRRGQVLPESLATENDYGSPASPGAAFHRGPGTVPVQQPQQATPPAASLWHLQLDQLWNRFCRTWRKLLVSRLPNSPRYPREWINLQELFLSWVWIRHLKVRLEEVHRDHLMVPHHLRGDQKVVQVWVVVFQGLMIDHLSHLWGTLEFLVLHRKVFRCMKARGLLLQELKNVREIFLRRVRSVYLLCLYRIFRSGRSPGKKRFCVSLSTWANSGLGLHWHLTVFAFEIESAIRHPDELRMGGLKPAQQLRSSRLLVMLQQIFTPYPRAAMLIQAYVEGIGVDGIFVARRGTSGFEALRLLGKEFSLRTRAEASFFRAEVLKRTYKAENTATQISDVVRKMDVD